MCVRASVHTCTLSESTRGPTTDILACGRVVGGERLSGGVARSLKSLLFKVADVCLDWKHSLSLGISLLHTSQRPIERQTDARLRRSQRLRRDHRRHLTASEVAALVWMAEK